jgi:predicted RNase H-like nuclease
VNRLVLEVLELLDQEPDLRDRLDQLHPELGAD